MPNQPLKPNQKKDQAKKPIASSFNDKPKSAAYLVDKTAEKPTQALSSSLKGNKS